MAKNPELEQTDVNCKRCGKTIKFSKWAQRLYGDMLFCGDNCLEIFSQAKTRKDAKAVNQVVDDNTLSIIRNASSDEMQSSLTYAHTTLAVSLCVNQLEKLARSIKHGVVSEAVDNLQHKIMLALDEFQRPFNVDEKGHIILPIATIMGCEVLQTNEPAEFTRADELDANESSDWAALQEEMKD